MQYGYSREFFIKLRLSDFISFAIFFWYSFNFCFFSLGILWHLFLPYSFLYTFFLFSFLYLFIACSLNLSLLFNNIFWLYLVLFLCFFDNKIFLLIFIYNKNLYSNLLFSFRLELFVMFIASSLPITQNEFYNYFL